MLIYNRETENCGKKGKIVRTKLLKSLPKKGKSKIQRKQEREEWLLEKQLRKIRKTISMKEKSSKEMISSYTYLLNSNLIGRKCPRCLLSFKESDNS